MSAVPRCVPQSTSAENSVTYGMNSAPHPVIGRIAAI